MPHSTFQIEVSGGPHQVKGDVHRLATSRGPFIYDYAECDIDGQTRLEVGTAARNQPAARSGRATICSVGEAVELEGIAREKAIAFDPPSLLICVLAT